MPASQVFSGSGDPNGVVDGNPGDLYQDQTGKLWLNVGAPSTWIQFAGGGDLGWFGTGVDGNHTVVGTETLLRDRFYQNLSIPAGAVLRTLGFRVYVAGTLTIAPGGILHNNGADGQNGVDAIPAFTNALGGIGGPTTNMLGGGNGGNGGFDDESGSPGDNTADYPVAEPTKHGGAGGNGTTDVGGAGGATTPQQGFGTYMISTMVVGSFVAGGPGGGGGAGNDSASGDVGWGGGAGGGGGTVMVSAKHINAAPGTIQARGGRGGDGASNGGGAGIGGGGGGGVGGTIIIVTNDPVAPTVDFSGGAGGVGINGGTNGTAGDNGARIAISPAWGPI